MQWRFHQERVQMAQVLQQMQEENLRLKIQLMEERKTKYTTPPEGTPAEGLNDSSRHQKQSGKKAKVKGQEPLRIEDFEAGRSKEAKEEQTQEAETTKDQEAETPRWKPKEGFEDHLEEGQQVEDKEDGSVDQQESEES
jgi:hypothetical protein